MALNSNVFLFLLSLVVVSFGGPTLSMPLSLAASAFGFSLFWKSIELSNCRFWLATCWYTVVQLVQWHWVTSTEYMGYGILVAYVLTCFAIGLQFGLMTYFLRPPYRWLQFGAIAGIWTLIEWSRTFLINGCFVWHPMGLSLAANDYSIQLASVFGVFGLSFWVLITNLAALKNKALWACLAIFPYLFGFCHQSYHESSLQTKKELTIALVQTALKPEQRDLTRGRKASHIPPIQQWDRVLSSLKDSKSDRYDLIILPEGAFPYGSKHIMYPLVTAEKFWSRFGAPSDLPAYQDPYVRNSYVTNSFFLQSLANHFRSEVIVGLEDTQHELAYNAAFHFKPNSDQIDRYHKQILIPIGEYIPFSLLSSFFADKYGITSSFAAGESANLFEGTRSVGICMCLEELYGGLMRKMKLAGADLFVNITNDVWFPGTSLPWLHFHHGRLRAVESGVYLLRSCNTGVTSVIDPFGHAERIIPVSEKSPGVLSMKIKVHSHPTFYTFWGDLPMMVFSALLSLSYLFINFRKKKLLRIGILN
jgi:apolipoprotein N-acyltransferase